MSQNAQDCQKIVKNNGCAKVDMQKIDTKASKR